MQACLNRTRWYLLACLFGLAGPALAGQVCVVRGDNTAAFQEATNSLLLGLQSNGIARAETRVISSAELAGSPLACGDDRLIVTLGTDALRQVAASNLRAPAIAGLIPRLSYERVLRENNRKGASSMAALYLDQPLMRQLELLRLALPQARRVGVLWGPESVSQRGVVSGALQMRGWELSEGVFVDGQSLSAALQSALADADVLLQMADAAVYNPSTVSNVLLTSYRAQVPVLAFSPGYVKAGALLSVHSTAPQAGGQLASMAAQFFQTNSVPLTQYPTEFSIAVNEYVARSLGLNLDALVLTDKLLRLEKRL